MSILHLATKPSFGILNFDWPEDLPDFRRFNLVYGWNRSGKTTLARIFTALQNRSIDFVQYPEGGMFEVITESGVKIHPENLNVSSLSVRVFCKDFVNDTVFFESYECKPIVYISEGDVESKKNLENLAKQQNDIIVEYHNAQSDKQSAERAVSVFLENGARNIKDTVGSLQVNDKYRTYNKGTLKSYLDNNVLGKSDELTDAEFDRCKSLIRTDAKQHYDSIIRINLDLEFDDYSFDDLPTLDSSIREVLNKTVVADTIDRLKDDPFINAWVKQGFDHQIERDDLQNCPYCEKPLDEGFLVHLRKHFSDNYQELYVTLERLLNALDEISIEKLTIEFNLYSDFSEDFKVTLEELNKCIDKYLLWKKDCLEKIKEKSKDPFSTIAPPLDLITGFQEKYDGYVDSLNKLITKHNTKAGNHDTEVRTNKERLERHIATVAIRENEYEVLIETQKETEKKLEKIAKEQDENKTEIEVLEKRTSDIGSAINIINKHLSNLFGGSEIQISLDSEGRGYEINRGSNQACNLSEGEKTAIAFAYFLAKINESSFDLSNGIVVIDDPISSLDSNFIFHCFALIQRQLADAAQLFIFTHNFTFFNLVKTWFNSKNRKKECCSFYTIENFNLDGVRSGHLVNMDKALRKFNSEYQYLFTILKKFSDNDSPSFDDLYTIGNIARRFLEIYVSFKIPKAGDLRGKVEQLKTTNVTDVQKDRLYRLVQVYSHADDPTTVIEHKDKSEAIDAIKILMQIVEETDPRHYTLLASSVS